MYSEPCQTSKMGIFAKSSIWDVLQGYKYASEFSTFFLINLNHTQDRILVASLTKMCVISSKLMFIAFACNTKLGSTQYNLATELGCGELPTGNPIH